MRTFWDHFSQKVLGRRHRSTNTCESGPSGYQNFSASSQPPGHSANDILPRDPMGDCCSRYDHRHIAAAGSEQIGLQELLLHAELDSIVYDNAGQDPIDVEMDWDA